MTTTPPDHRYAARAVLGSLLDDSLRTGHQDDHLTAYRAAFGDAAADDYLAEMYRVAAALPSMGASAEDETRAVRRLTRNAYQAVDDYTSRYGPALSIASRDDALRSVVEVTVAYLIGAGLVTVVDVAEVPPVVIGGEVIEGITAASGTELPAHLQPGPPAPAAPGEAPFVLGRL